MDRMIKEYNEGKLNDKQVCSSIRRITYLNERQCAYCETRIALKLFNKMPMNYQCMEPCVPSAEEELIEDNKRRMLSRFLEQIETRYPNWKARTSRPMSKWASEIRKDIMNGVYGKDIKEYLEETWLRKNRL